MKTKGKSGVMDMTQGNMAMLILSFALPLMLGNVFQQFYTVADTAIVGENTWSGCVGSTRHCRVDKLAGYLVDQFRESPRALASLFPSSLVPKKRRRFRETIFHASFLAVVAAILFTVGILNRITWFGRDFTGSC